MLPVVTRHKRGEKAGTCSHYGKWEISPDKESKSDLFRHSKEKKLNLKWNSSESGKTQTGAPKKIKSRSVSKRLTRT